MAEDHPSSTHPPIPPTTEDDRFDRLRLLRSRRVGIATYKRLMAEHGSARAALDALPDVAFAAGLRDYHICPEALVQAELRAGRDAGARLIFAGEADFPSDLSDLEDAPPFLWALGDTSVLARPRVAIIGARNASSLGLRMARALACDLGQAGIVVVSGLARGIDAAAHASALPTGTIAVMGGGVDVLYPQENARLARDIVAAGGLRISEQPMTLTPQARHFPIRNRLISGLSRAVIVVEAAMKSGSLITARAALDQGREVMAVPGHPFDTRAGGCNALIRDGALMVRGSRDVCRALDLAGADRTDVAMVVNAEANGRAKRPEAPPDIAALHRQILARLGPSPVAEDQLIRDLGHPLGRIGPALTDLELDGRIARIPGGMLALK